MGMSWLILFEIIRLPKLSKVQMKRHNALLLLCTILDPLPTLSWRDKTAVVVDNSSTCFYENDNYVLIFTNYDLVNYF